MIAISVVCIGLPEQSEQWIVKNIKNIERKIIVYFGPAACRIYGVPIDFKFIPSCLSPKKLADWHGI